MNEIIEIPMLPYDNGVISINDANSHIVRLTDSTFIAVGSQHKPNVMIGVVIDVDVINGAATMRSQNVIKGLISGSASETQSTYPVTRLARLSDTKCLIIYDTETASGLIANNYHCQVLELSEDGFVRKILSEPILLGNLYDSVRSLALEQIGDNVVLVSQMTASNVCQLKRITYDPNSNSLSSVIVGGFTDSKNTTHSHRFTRIVKVPNSNGFFVTVSSGANGSFVPARSSTQIIAGMYVDITTVDAQNEFTDPVVTGSRRTVFCPLSRTTGIFTDGVNFEYWEDGSYYPPAYIENALGATVYATPNAFVMDDGLIILESQFGASNTSDREDSQKPIRVVKVYSSEYARCSVSTRGTSSVKGILTPKILNYVSDGMKMINGVMVITGIVAHNSTGFKIVFVKP